jgi:hypothetical protein
VAFTGIGFTPVGGSFKLYSYSGAFYSDGFDDGTRSNCLNVSMNVWGYTTMSLGNTYSMASAAGGTGQKAIVKSWDADGFTLTWTRVDLSSAGTLTFLYKVHK